MSNTRLNVILSSEELTKRTKIVDKVDNSIQSKIKQRLTKEQDSLLDFFKLKFFYASLFATILEDSITQIRILGDCSNELRIIKTMADMMLLRVNKFAVAPGLLTDELDTIDPKDLGKEEYKLEKLAFDRQVSYDTILVTYLDLSMHRNFDGLTQQIAEIVNRDEYRATLAETEAKNKITHRQLEKQLRRQRNRITSATYDIDVTINNLKSQFEDANLNAAVRSRYVTNWEGARTEQHHLTIQNTESPLLMDIVTYKQNLDCNQRSHTEVMLLMNIMIHETMEKVEKMMTKYDEDIEALDLKIQTIKSNHVSKVEMREELEIRYAKHVIEAREWVHFKDEREKARLYREKIHNAATVAQAWWRGLMVRLQLGPYKPKGVKKGKK